MTTPILSQVEYKKSLVSTQEEQGRVPYQAMESYPRVSIEKLTKTEESLDSVKSIALLQGIVRGFQGSVSINPNCVTTFSCYILLDIFRNNYYVKVCPTLFEPMNRILNNIQPKIYYHQRFNHYYIGQPNALLIYYGTQIIDQRINSISFIIIDHVILKKEKSIPPKSQNGPSVTRGQPQMTLSQI